MVHTFRCLGHIFMLDAESGSVFEIDDKVENIINDSPNDFSSGDFSGFDNADDATKEAVAELKTLYNEGVLFSKAADSRVEAEYSGIVKAMCLNITHRCSLRCEYCFAGGGEYRGGKTDMDIDTAKAAVDFLIARSGNRKNLEIDFFGGEPLMNFDTVRETVAYAHGKEKESGKTFKFTLTTNAYDISDEVIDFLNKEIFNVVISLDGRDEVHNCVRKTVAGGDSFSQCLENARRFKAKRGDKQYYVRGTFTGKNKDFAKDVLYLSELGFDQLSLEPVVLPETHRLAIKESDLSDIFAEYERLADLYLQRRKDEKTWFNFFHFMLDLYNGPCESKRLKGCGAGCEYVAVNPDGSIYPCHQFDGDQDFLMGNVNSLKTDDAVAMRFYKNTVNSKEQCRECWAKYYCSGGCAANAHYYNKSLSCPHKIACEMMKKRIECAVTVNYLESEI